MKDRTIDKRIHRLLEKLAENPRDEETRLALGKLYFLGSHFHDAVKCYQELLELNPANVSAYYNLGVAYLAQKKNEEARAAFQRILELDPNNEAAQNELDKLVSFP
jgi:cytochrome c-type biogenesis protein CcmH/NrfG